MPHNKTAHSKTLGANLRRARRRAGLSLEDVGQALGVRFQSIQKYETGYTKISIEKLQQFAELVQCPITTLLPILPPKPKTPENALPSGTKS